MRPAILLGCVLGARLALAQAGIEDSVPPGARGAVLAFAGEVRTIMGLSAALGARVDPLAAALADLGARTSETEIRIELSADVLFGFDEADLKPEAEASLHKVAAVLRGYPRSQVTVGGHTDGKGSHAYNQGLSERRAASVLRWLRAQAEVGGNRLAARGFGATRPVAPNARSDGSDDPEGRRRNRRVEIVVSR